jgi:hypothetical protein
MGGVRASAPGVVRALPSVVAGARHYKELRCWQMARELKLAIYQLLERHAVERDWKFKNQLMDAAASVPTNIAEGFVRKTTRTSHISWTSRDHRWPSAACTWRTAWIVSTGRTRVRVAPTNGRSHDAIGLTTAKSSATQETTPRVVHTRLRVSATLPPRTPHPEPRTALRTSHPAPRTPTGSSPGSSSANSRRRT